jgi:hypothetical protein
MKSTFLILFLFISLVRAGYRNSHGVDMEPIVEVEETLECLCCYEEKPLVSHCKNIHQVCEECIANFLANKVDEGNTNLCCPEQQCEEVFSEKDIKKYLGDEKYREYEALVQEQCINEAIANGDLDGFEKCPHVCHPL